MTETAEQWPDKHVWEIPPEQIRPAPWNPPSRLEPERVQELAHSILKEGQQSPALIRPVEAEPPIRYEIVWGHRRAAAINLLNGEIAAGAESAPETAPDFFSLKTFIREMTEEEAMISSGIENLQREGFSDIEEAEFFRTAGARYGESAVKILSEKLSISPRYIRKRIKILELPEMALELWRPGTWHVGHMEQLLRLGGKEEVEAFLKEALSRHRGPDDWPVWELKDRIDRLAVPLHAGNFDKADCKACVKNTDCQHKLFDLGHDKKTQCLDPDCFTRKQQAWLDLNWASAKANKWGTQAAIIGDYGTKHTGEFQEKAHWGVQPGEKCTSCAQFTTILTLGNGKFHPYREMACLGKADCFAAVCKSKKKAGKKEKAKNEPDAPRVAWHGEHFRQQFYQQEIPRLMAELGADDPRRLQVALALLVHSARGLHEWFWGEKLGLEVPTYKNSWEHFQASFYQLLQEVKGKNSLEAELLLSEVLVRIALQPGRGYETTLYDQDRQALAEFLDINWSRFQVTEDYLEKKTKAEIIRFIAQDSGLATEPAFLESMAGQGFKTIEKLAGAKKPALMELLLNCGVDLHGRLPKEIATRLQLKTDA